MIELKVNPKIFKNIIRDDNLIGGRSEGKIYKLTRILLVKIYHKAIFPILNEKEDLITEDLNDRSKIKNLIKKRNKIKKSSLPVGFVTYNNYLVGVVIVRQLFTLPFEQWIQGKADKDREKLLKKLEIKQEELILNNIYYIDFNETNILVKSNGDPKLVDFDGEVNQALEHPNSKYLKLVKESFNRLKDSILRGK